MLAMSLPLAVVMLTLERLRSAVIKASGRLELENSQDPSGQGRSGFFAAEIYH
jgi:hypothetical protein